MWIIKFCKAIRETHTTDFPETVNTALVIF